MPQLTRKDVDTQDGSERKTEADLIRLQVGECQFTTTLSTLTDESTFFASMFSGDWNNPKTPDGAIFIDSDGHSFRHILAYLRSGRFPLFYDAGSHEFDFAQYQALLGEAKFFGIPRLQQWIEQHQYHKAIERHHQRQIFSSEDAFDNYGTLGPTMAAGTLAHCSYTWGNKKVYICPRAIPVHRGNPDACGQGCHRVLQGGPRMFEDEPSFKGFVVTTTYTWKPEVCLGENFTP